jgi:hypothetical protein
MLRAVILSLTFGAVATAAAPPPFERYPDTRLLCSEHVTGNNMHITWQTYASKDDMAKVVAFYEKSTKQKPGKGDKGEVSFDGADPANDKMSIYPAAKNNDFPSCATKPAAGEKTVIMISKAIR